MSLLKKHIEANPLKGTREIAYATLLSVVAAKPVEVNGELKDKVCATIQTEDGKANLFLFKDACANIPAFIPETGVRVQLVLQESKDKQYVNAVYLGVAA